MPWISSWSISVSGARASTSTLRRMSSSSMPAMRNWVSSSPRGFLSPIRPSTSLWHWEKNLAEVYGHGTLFRQTQSLRMKFFSKWSCETTVKSLKENYPVSRPLFFFYLFHSLNLPSLILVTDPIWSLLLMMMMMKWCLMPSDVGWHVRDKLRPMPKHGSINLYVHGSQKAR